MIVFGIFVWAVFASHPTVAFLLFVRWLFSSSK